MVLHRKGSIRSTHLLLGGILRDAEDLPPGPLSTSPPSSLLPTFPVTFLTPLLPPPVRKGPEHTLELISVVPEGVEDAITSRVLRLLEPGQDLGVLNLQRLNLLSKWSNLTLKRLVHADQSRNELGEGRLVHVGEWVLVRRIWRGLLISLTITRTSGPLPLSRTVSRELGLRLMVCPERWLGLRLQEIPNENSDGNDQSDRQHRGQECLRPSLLDEPAEEQETEDEPHRLSRRRSMPSRLPRPMTRP